MTTIDYPGATSTSAVAISGNNIVCWTSLYEEFIYNGTSWSDRLNPGWSIIRGISGNTFVGYDSGSVFENHNHGFVANGMTWTSLYYPGAIDTAAFGIDGSNIVGYYKNEDSAVNHGFLYNGGNWTPLNAPGYSSTIAYGISGDNIVGQCDDDSFIFNIITQSWTTIVAPGVSLSRPLGISGDNILFELLDGSGRDTLYNMTTQNWTVLDLPEGAYANGIDGSNIVWYLWK